MTERTIGQLVDAAGISADDLRNDDMISGAIVLLKTVDPESGEVSLFIARSEHLDFIDVRGMLDVAMQIERFGHTQ